MFVGAAEYFRPRPDVAELFGSAYLNSGYQITVQGLQPGVYTFTAFAHSSRSGTFTIARQSTVTIAPSVHIVIDTPVARASVGGVFDVAGWALDRSSLTGPGIGAVHVWAYPAGGAPIFIGGAVYGASRPDIGALFGGRYARSGFDVSATLPAGTYNIVAFARSTTTNSFNGVRLVQVTVQ